MIRTFLCALLVMIALPAHAEEAAKEPPHSNHPIEKALQACMEKAVSTADMVACEDKAFSAWDDELNRVYKELQGKLNAKQKDALKASQLAWIKHKDAELAWVAALYETFDGTMYHPMRIDAAKAVIQRRAEELKGYLDTLNEHGTQPEDTKGK